MSASGGWIRGMRQNHFVCRGDIVPQKTNAVKTSKVVNFLEKKWKVQIRLHLLRMFEKSLDIRNVFSYNMKRISDVWPSKSIKIDCLKTAHHRISICVHLRDTIKRCRVRQVIISITGRFFYPAFCSFANTHMCK